MTADDSSREARFAELRGRAQEARVQAWMLRRQVSANRRAFKAVRQQVLACCEQIQAQAERAEQIRRLWLAPNGQDRRQYSAYARLQAQPASMPVIEQAKGIIMAQCGWTAEQAFDALRRASQRNNIKVRELAAQIVARTADSARRRHAGPAWAEPRRAADRAFPRPTAAIVALPVHGRERAGTG